MTELDSRINDIDVESILARVEKREPFTFSRRRCIYQAPEFTQRLPAHETVEEGSVVTFGCKVLGFPKPTVTWYKDDDVIGTGSRADITVDEDNIHSLKLQDVSKCDAGNYRVCATNLEGSSSSSLCITVKAKSKNRNRKKKKTRTVVCAPLFPVIVENEADERRETLAVEEQDESPLTPLYTNISRRSPVSWPAFLGDWAYNNEDGLHRGIEDMESGCEDVFESDSDHSTQESLTFVCSATAHTQRSPHETEVTRGNREDISEADNGHGRSNKVTSKKPGNDKIATVIGVPRKEASAVKPPNTLNLASTVEENYKILTIDDVINSISDRGKARSSMNLTNFSAVSDTSEFKIPPKEIEDKTIHFNHSEASQITVNRSYAKGDATLSVATRSSSPYRSLRDRSNGSAVKTDTDTKHYQNNERSAQWMRQLRKINFSKKSLSALIWTGSAEDNIADIILLICGCTFLALCFDLSPFAFVFYFFITLLLTFGVSTVLKYL